MADELSPTDRIINWIDGLDPDTRMVLLIKIATRAPREWINGLDWRLSLEDPARWWALMQGRLEELTDEAHQNVGVALCLQALITYQLEILASDVEEHVEHIASMPLSDNVRDQLIREQELTVRRLLPIALVDGPSITFIDGDVTQTQRRRRPRRSPA